MLMLLILPLLPYGLSCAAPELFQAVLELLVLFLFLLIHAPLPLRVEGFGGAPFLPCEFFDLVSYKEHHVGVCGFVRVGFEKVGEELVILKLSWSYCQKFGPRKRTAYTYDLSIGSLPCIQSSSADCTALASHSGTSCILCT